MKEAVTKVIDTLTQEEIHGAFQKLLEQYNNCIAAGGYYFEEDSRVSLCTINKSAHTKKVWKLIVCASYIFGVTVTPRITGFVVRVNFPKSVVLNSEFFLFFD